MDIAPGTYTATAMYSNNHHFDRLQEVIDLMVYQMRNPTTGKTKMKQKKQLQHRRPGEETRNKRGDVPQNETIAEPQDSYQSATTASTEQSRIKRQKLEIIPQHDFEEQKLSSALVPKRVQHSRLSMFVSVTTDPNKQNVIKKKLFPQHLIDTSSKLKQTIREHFAKELIRICPLSQYKLLALRGSCEHLDKPREHNSFWSVETRDGSVFDQWSKNLPRDATFLNPHVQVCLVSSPTALAGLNNQHLSSYFNHITPRTRTKEDVEYENQSQHNSKHSKRNEFGRFIKSNTTSV